MQTTRIHASVSNNELRIVVDLLLEYLRLCSFKRTDGSIVLYADSAVVAGAPEK